MNNRTITRLTLSCIGILAVGAYACSSSDTGALDPGGFTGGTTSSGGSGGTIPTVTGGSAGSAVSGAGGTTGGTGGSGIAGSSIIDPTQGGTAGTPEVNEDAACGTGEASADLKEVTMFIMFDRSWSMTQCSDPTQMPPLGMQDSLACTDGVTPSRWELTSQALTLFFQDPAAADLHVALRFFPDDVAGCTGFDNNAMMTPNCDATICAQPQVDLGVLTADAAPTDAQEAALVAAVAGATPPGPAIPNPNPATPTSAALGGAEQWAIAHQMASPNEQTVVVLVTDGEPYGCDTSTNNIATLARDAYMNAGVLTYVIGLTGSSEQQLNQLAAAGGTDQAYFVADGSTATQDLLNALLAIRGMPITCDFAVPTSTATGDEIDPHLINVNYTAAGGADVELGLVADASACGAEQAWYYDNPDMPTRIILCPSACTTITGDPMAQIQILAGCKPRITVPK